MTIELSSGALKLLKFCLFFTGEKEFNAQGVEMNSPRRLNGEESAQRRHFVKAFDPVEKDVDGKIDEIVKEFNAAVDVKKAELKESRPRREDESKEDYEARVVDILNKDEELLEKMAKTNERTAALRREKCKLEITEKTKEVLKKYFSKFGEEYGFLSADDEYVEELDTALA